MIKIIKDYLANYFKWNTKISAKTPERFLLQFMGYCLLTELIYRALSVIDLFLVKKYNLFNTFYADGMFYIRGLLWLYLWFCTFNKLKITFNKKWNYVIVPLLILIPLKWICPYFFYKFFGFQFYVVAKKIIPFVVVAYCIFYVWFVNNKDIKNKFKRIK